MKSSLVALSVLFLATAAQAQDAPAGSDADSTPRNESGTASRSGDSREREERQICRRVEDTGSRIAARRQVCLTPRQWRNYGDR